MVVIGKKKWFQKIYKYKICIIQKMFWLILEYVEGLQCHHKSQ